MALKSIGALWLKEGKSGKFMAGNIEVNGEEIGVMVFKNDKGDNPKRPDYRIMVIVEEDEDGYRQNNVAPDEDDDIPF